MTSNDAATESAASAIEAVLRKEWTFSDEDGGEDAFADLAERLARHGVRITEHGDPTRPCGRGPCALGDQHPGPCHL